MRHRPKDHRLPDDSPLAKVNPLLTNVETERPKARGGHCGGGTSPLRDNGPPLLTLRCRRLSLGARVVRGAGAPRGAAARGGAAASSTAARSCRIVLGGGAIALFFDDDGDDDDDARGGGGSGRDGDATTATRTVCVAQNRSRVSPAATPQTGALELELCPLSRARDLFPLSRA